MNPLDRAVLTAALDAPGARGAIADLARAILDGHITMREAARSAVLAEALDPERLAAAKRAAEDPRVVDTVRRLREAYRRPAR